MVVGYDLPGCHVGGLDESGTQLHEVAQLAGRARPSVEPDNGGNVLDLVSSSPLLAVEHEGQSGASLVDVEVSAPDETGVVKGGGGEINSIADGGQFDFVVVLLLGEDAVLDVDALLLKEGRGVQRVGGDEDSDCLLYTSPSPRDQRGSRMPSSA